MLEYITFALVVAKIVLDFVAPRTKTKVDDTARDVLNKIPMPSKSPAPAAKPVEGFTTGSARDHRK